MLLLNFSNQLTEAQLAGLLARLSLSQRGIMGPTFPSV